MKSRLVLQLAELTEALGEKPTPLVYASLSREELEARIAEAKRRLAQKAAESGDSVAAARRRNDNEWYDAGGTRN